MELKEPASEYQERQWETLESTARKLERHCWNRWETQTEKIVKEIKNLSETASKGLEAEEMLPKELWIQTGETFWGNEEKREQTNAEREYRLNSVYII